MRILGLLLCAMIGGCAAQGREAAEVQEPDLTNVVSACITEDVLRDGGVSEQEIRQWKEDEAKAQAEAAAKPTCA